MSIQNKDICAARYYTIVKLTEQKEQILKHAERINLEIEKLVHLSFDEMAVLNEIAKPQQPEEHANEEQKESNESEKEHNQEEISKEVN